MAVVYSAVKQFDPACGGAWQKYTAWSGLKQLREVVSLDLILCPTVFEDLIAEDWEHNVQENFKITLFHDLDYVVRRELGHDFPPCDQGHPNTEESQGCSVVEIKRPRI